MAEPELMVEHRGHLRQLQMAKSPKLAGQSRSPA
jgi:hypothetical protein